ncbi:MAG TPA: hypothetical protein VNW99_04705 [Cytophagaceae bacterium]|jgi:hypothetical protein|nr:hypothetical protein [Cytophagaceae bacterium]
MKDFIKVFLLIAASVALYWGLFLLYLKVNPFLIAFIGLIIAVAIILSAILIWKKR